MPSLLLLNIGGIITPVGRTMSLSALIQSIQTVKAPLLPAGVADDVKKQKVVAPVPLSPAQLAHRLRTCPAPRTSMQGFWWM